LTSGAVREVGLFGGTFNPVHLGHLRVAEEIAESLSLSEIILMPAADPPHTGPRGLAPRRTRIQMLKLAARGRPGFVVSDLEGRLAGPSYTVNTLRALREELGEGTLLRFLVGYDSFKHVGLWMGREELFRLASFVVFLRPGASSGRENIGRILSGATGGGWVWDQAASSFNREGYLPVRYFRQESMLRISSTVLRKRLEEGRSVRYLVPEAVRAYIERRGLYRAP
jgi:nicotinate-nucleotide adenylyltransferase